MSEQIKAVPVFPYKPEKRRYLNEHIFEVEPGDVPGMNLRDLFAAFAMKEHMREWRDASSRTTNDWHGDVAKLAYETADAMMKVRSKS